MHVLGNNEYEELVTDLADCVFAPLSSDQDVVDRSRRILDLVEEDKQDQAKAVLREAAEDQAKMQNGLDGHDVLNNRLDGSLAGSIIEHSDHAYRVKTDDVDANSAFDALTEMALEALYLDVKSEASRRARKIVNSD